MVTLLPEFSNKDKVGTPTAGGDTPRFYPPSFLAPPRYGVPDKLILSGVNLGVAELSYNAECYTELSKWSSDQLGLELYVDIHSDGMGNSLVIDTHASYHTIAIGPRIELLEKYYNCGGWLLSLMHRSPLSIWTPECVVEYAKSYDWLHEIGPMYPEWAQNNLPRYLEAKRPNMPPNLSRIVDECLKIERRGSFCDLENAQEFPFVITTWYGNSPDFNKSTIGLNPYVADWKNDRGTNKTWMLIDVIADTALQSGWGFTCSDAFHDEEKYKDHIRDSVPFMKLLKYLGHETRKDGFSLCF